jgi:diguanylate cyclase (GGDEF)-like protein/PAS domain S-box-containing protein
MTPPIADSLFRLMLEQNSFGIILTDRDANIVYANPRQLEASGYTQEEVLGRNARIFSSGNVPREVYESMWTTILAGHVWHGELTNRRKNGEICRELMRIAPVRDDQGVISHFFAIKEENLYGEVAALLGGEIATVDPTTGLPNRAMLAEHITLVVRASEIAANGGSQDPREGFSVLTLDIDHFQLLNDSIGHLAADELLQRIGTRLKEAARQTDLVARTGGNEFCLLLPGSIDQGMLEDLGRRLLSAVSTPLQLQGRKVAITASIGIARFPLDGRDSDTLLQRAFAAMSAAKSGGGDTLCFYTPPAEQQAAEFTDITAGLREVVARDELRLHYQPKVDLKSGQVVGLEALVRWAHPEHGLLAPGRFIPVAEETGLIVNLSQWVIHAALAQQQRWLDAGLPLLPIGVNLSLRHFRSGDLPAFIAHALSESGLPPSCIELEISDSAMMRDPTYAFVVVDRIRELGVRLALDDFGTGLSSLSYLSRLTVDALKIDQSFVRDITTNPVNASIVAAIIAMAHKLGKRTVAVGVESEGQARQLRRQDCDEIQGYYFSKPLPADEVAELLKQGRKLGLKEDSAIAATEPTLLLVDDEPNIINALKRLLRREGYRILTASSGNEALELLAVNQVHVILSDHRMPGMSGIEFLSRARDLYPHTRRIILSGYSDIGTLTDAINRGAVWKFISKPWEDEALKSEVQRAFDLKG